MRCHITHKLRIAVLHAFALKQIAQPRQTRTCLSLECAKRARNDVLTGKNLEQIEWAVFEGAPCSLLRHTGIVLSSQAARCAPYCNHVMRSCMPRHAALEIGARSASSEQLPVCRALPRARELSAHDATTISAGPRGVIAIFAHLHVYLFLSDVQSCRSIKLDEKRGGGRRKTVKTPDSTEGRPANQRILRAPHALARPSHVPLLLIRL